MNELEQFYSDLKRVIYILQFQDKNLAESWLSQLNSNLKPEYLESCLTAAIFELSVTDINTFHWVLDNLSDWQTYTQLLQKVTKFIIQKLIKKGFILGQHFSATFEGKILIDEKATDEIMSDVSETDNLLIKKVLLLAPEVHSLQKS